MTNLGQINSCEAVAIEYHQGSNGPGLDSFVPIAVSISGLVPLLDGSTCAVETDGGLDVIGSITAISPTSITVSVNGLPIGSFPIDRTTGLAGGNQVGDSVDVTYDPTSGNLVTSIQTTEAFLTGTVTSVSPDSLTLNSFGRSVTFGVGLGGFAHIAKGDQLGVLYSVNAGSPVADSVTDFTSGAAT
jgi:hypothetical protein